MKCKFLSLILVLLLLPGAIIISACGKDDGYNLTNLSTDFYSIAETENDNIIKQNNQLKFDYSHHIHDSEEFINNAVNTVPVYTNLARYNTIFDNIISFSCSYIEACSTDIEIDANISNNLEKSLNELHSAMSDVNSCTNMFAEPLKITPQEELATNFACLESFKNLLSSYETLFQKAATFSNNLENIYFNYVLTNSNPNLTNVNVEEFDANVVINNLDARIKWQISNLTKTYVEMYVVGGNLAETIKNGGSINLNKNNYLTNVNAIKYNLNSETAAEIANNAANKNNFYNLSVQAYNAQSIISNDNYKYTLASNAIVYTDVVNSMATASANDLLRKQVIDDYHYLLGQYNTVLTSMINILKV